MELFTKDLQPFSIVEDKGFTKFINILNPSYQLPSRKTLSNTLLPALYEEKYSNVQEVIKNVKSVTITTDCWTSVNTESFMATTAHFIDDNFNAKSVLLECSCILEAHTSKKLAEELKRVVCLWGLENKILLAISDNAANIQKAIREELKWKHFGCYAHTINLIVQDGLKLGQPIILKVRTLVSHFKRSTTASQKLSDVQKQSGQIPMKLLQDVATRWNSTYYMLNRILDMEEVVRTTMALLNSNNLPIISVEEWKFLADIKKVLKPMEELTKIISGQNYVTLSSVIVLTKGLENIYTEMKRENNLPTIDNLISQFLKGISERLGELESSKTLLVSTLLDPRFKNVGFSSDAIGEKAKKIVTNLVSTKISEVSSTSNQIKQLTVGAQQSQQMSNSGTPSSVWGQFDKKVASVSAQIEVPTISRAIIEVQRYLEEPLLDRHEDPLKWWLRHAYNYPHLSKIVIEKFGNIATSVPCERIFSKSGQLVSERRSRLSSNKVKQIMFLNVNSEF